MTRTLIRCARAVILLGVLTSTIHAEQPSISLRLDRDSFAPGDTVVLALDIDIPRGYYLCGNPVGPGPGKPLEVRPERVEGVRWLETRAPEPRRIGDESDKDWVWGYRFGMTLYTVGVIEGNARSKLSGTVRMLGLMCKSACDQVSVSAPFVLAIKGSKGERPFDDSPLERARYSRAKALAAVTASSKPASVPTVQTVRETLLAEPTGVQREGSERRYAEEDVDSQTTSPDAPPVPRRADAWDIAVPEWDYAPLEVRARLNLALAILFAFIGGILLNVMPCVLPVLGIKILSFSEGREGSRRETLRRSLVFSAGMMSIFVVLASLAAFANFSWGEQFRHPMALSVVVCVIVVFALGLFDLYTLVVPAGVGNGAPRRTGNWREDFVRGVLATIMATPCSGPLLGATLAWTLSQSVLVVYAVFVAIGAGMALPYVVLASSRRLMRLVPKPGRWMDDFKHLMGFLLLGSALYLMVGLRAEMIVATMAVCLGIVLALVVHQRFAPLDASRLRRALVAVVAILLAAGAFRFGYGTILPALSANGERESSTALEWRLFSPDALSEAHARGEHVLVDFTASWCMNCQYNKAVVLEHPSVAAVLREKNVILLKADLTSPNPAAESLLEHLGSRSIPFLAVFPGDDPYQPTVMRDVLRRSAVLELLASLPDR